MLNSQQNISVTFEDGSTGELTVRQLPLREYESALILVDDEIALTAKICGAAKEKIYSLCPDSYESARQVATTMNPAFFAFADRRAKQVADRLNSVRPEVLDKLAKVSPVSQPGLRPQ